MREHVLKQDVDAGVEVWFWHPHRQMMRWDVYGHPPFLVLGERTPVRGSLHEHEPSVTGGAAATGARPSRLADDLVDGPGQRVYVADDPGHELLVAAQQLGVDPQRGERCTQPVRQVGERLSFVGQQLTDPVGEPVETAAYLLDLRRSVDRGPCSQIAGAQLLGRDRDIAERPDQTAGELGGHAYRHREQTYRDQPEQQP